MAQFQFMCPQGHLLEGHVSQAGQQCRCPQCGTTFIIPNAAAADVESESEPFAGVGLPGGGAFAGGAFDGLAGFPNAADFPDVAGLSPMGTAADAGADRELILHIPCPNGHPLEVPSDMLGQDVICPHCGAQFTLQAKDSLEYQRHENDASERYERQRGKMWLNLAISIGVIVAIALVAMIVMAVNR
jgi:uncharacterized C2H2 Zn-finger protein